MNRQEIVQSLVSWNGDLDALSARIAEFPFDAESALVMIRCEDLVRALRRFLRGEVSARDIEQWADAVEGRDDIEYEPDHAGVISELLSSLSNPEINGTLSQEHARSMLARLPKG